MSKSRHLFHGVLVPILAGPPGIEPSPSLGKEVESRNLNIEETLKKYLDFCLINRGMQRRVAKDYREYAVRFLRSCKGVVSEDTVRDYLTTYLSKKPKTYNNQLEGLRSFVGRFLNRMDIMDRFKRLWQPTCYERELPSKQQIRRGFEALEKDDERALYLLCATSGLRKMEALTLKETDIDFHMRCLKPKHDTRTKKAGVSFYNAECSSYVEKLEIKKGKLFRIGKRRFVAMWERASEKADFRLTPQSCVYGTAQH